MVRRTTRNATEGIELSPVAAAALHEELPAVAERTVAAIIDEVPSYANALSGPMGETIRGAVELALGTFLKLAVRKRDSTATPMTPAVEGAYQLGRGEARSGRSMEALLAAYRIGARVSWRDLSRAVVERGMPAAELSEFAQLVFAYIDELSAASAAGHTDELENTGRVRRRNLDRLIRALLSRAPADAVNASAEHAEWEPPPALSAVLLPASRIRQLVTLVDPRSLQPTEDVQLQVEDRVLLLVADTGSRAARQRLLRAVAGVDAVVGPTMAWTEAAASYERALRVHAHGVDGDHDA
ncbi:MAG: PucR family transcriptional regulator, partial [Nocardioides sp.]|nr:PucR family transcriptional regulator [Nocardioides sp.]